MKNRLVSVLLVSLVASLSFAIACSQAGGPRSSTSKKDGGGNTIKLDGGADAGNNNPDDPVDLKKPNTQPDLKQPPTDGLTCQEFFSCLGACADTDTTCPDDCFNNTSAAGQTQFNDLFNCLANECVSSGDCEVNSTGDGLVQSTACSTCLNADPTWTACSTEVNACE